MCIILAPYEYMALALSKDDTFSKFDGADAVVTGVDKNGKGFAIDYYFESDNKVLLQKLFIRNNKCKIFTDLTDD